MATKRRANSEGTIVKRADGRWMAMLTLPGGKRRAFYGHTQAEALKKMDKSKRNLQDGLPLPPERVNLANYLARWLEDSVKPTLKPYTYQSYETQVRRHISPELGRIRLARLSPQDIQGLLNRKRESGLSARSVQYIHAVLRRALWQAERWGFVSRNVARLVSPPRVSRPEVHPLMPTEVRRLLIALEGDRQSALYTVALAVGLRQGEALGLRWQDVDLETGLLSIRFSLQRVEGQTVLAETKTEKSRRTIKLPQMCIAALRLHKDRQEFEKAIMAGAWQDQWGLVFTKEDGSPLSRYAVTRRFQRILSEAGIDRHRFHDLRHTCATLLLAAGVPLKVVQETLGHTLFSTTADIYSHVLPTLMDDAATKMDAILLEA